MAPDGELVVTSGRQAGGPLSVNVGMPQDVTWHGRTVHTAVWKKQVAGRGWCGGTTSTVTGRMTWPGTAASGAVFVYQIESHRYWQDRLRRDDFTYGQFRENLTDCR